MEAAEKAPTSYREVWDRKPVLRAIYGDIYRRILHHVVPGPILEIGGGSGNFKDFAPDTVSTDILPAPWLDLVCDAQALPFADASFANIVMVDVLHHIENPVRFLTEAARVLRPGGRLVACEPAITPLSGIFYRRFHDEPVDMSVDPLKPVAALGPKDPYDSNQAIPTLMVGRYREACRHAVPDLALDPRRLLFLPCLSSVGRISRMEPHPRGSGRASAGRGMDGAAAVRPPGGVPAARRLPPIRTTWTRTIPASLTNVTKWHQ